MGNVGKGVAGRTDVHHKHEIPLIFGMTIGFKLKNYPVISFSQQVEEPSI